MTELFLTNTKRLELLCERKSMDSARKKAVNLNYLVPDGFRSIEFNITF